MRQDGWVRLSGQVDRDFRLQRAALLEYACATLPTRLSRRVVKGAHKDPSVMPAEIWRSDDDLALVWHVRHEQAAQDSQPRRVVGFVQQSPAGAVQLFDLPPDQPIPPVFGGVEPVQFAAQFWQSDRHVEPLVSAGTAPALPAAFGDGAPAERHGDDARAQISKACEDVDQGFRAHVARATSRPLVDFELVETSTPDSAISWRLQDSLQERVAVARLLDKAGVCNFHLEADALERMVLLERDVPFYKGCLLYRVIDMRGPRSRFASFVLHCESADLVALHTESTPIHAFNARRFERGELVIDEASVAAYVRFFCEFVHGASGAFSIIEHPREIRWLSQAGEGTQGDEVLRQAVNQALRPMMLYRPRFGPPQTDPPLLETASAEAALALYCRAFIGYGRDMFAAGFAVSVNGWLEMFSDASLHEAPLPIQPLSFNVEFQFKLRTDTVRPEARDVQQPRN